MNWADIIEFHRTALLRVLAALFAAAGIAPGETVSTLPRSVRCYVVRFLQSAEAAALRLIVIAARGVVVEPRTATERQTGLRKAKGRAETERLSAFPLLDRQWNTAPSRVRYARGPGPRMWSPGDPDWMFPPVPPPPSADDPINAASVCRRLQRLQLVLDDLPKQAKRLARLKGKYRRRPIRPGRPPGHRARPIHEVDTVLAECHQLARRVLSEAEPPG